MKSARPGSTTSGVELRNVSRQGFCLVIDRREHKLTFDDFPWFRSATVEQLSNIERPSDNHLRWPALDVDLTLASIEDPGRYPLVSRAD